MEKQFPTIDKVKTGKQIRHLMDSLGLTVMDAQKYMGLATQQAVYHWLNGRSLPSIDNVYALSELFRVPIRLFVKIGDINLSKDPYIIDLRHM
mgnify:CR=1 FL=1